MAKKPAASVPIKLPRPGCRSPGAGDLDAVVVLPEIRLPSPADGPPIVFPEPAPESSRSRAVGTGRSRSRRCRSCPPRRASPLSGLDFWMPYACVSPEMTFSSCVLVPPICTSVFPSCSPDAFALAGNTPVAGEANGADGVANDWRWSLESRAQRRSLRFRRSIAGAGAGHQGRARHRVSPPWWTRALNSKTVGPSATVPVTSVPMRLPSTRCRSRPSWQGCGPHPEVLPEMALRGRAAGAADRFRSCERPGCHQRRCPRERRCRSRRAGRIGPRHSFRRWVGRAALDVDPYRRFLRSRSARRPWCRRWCWPCPGR